MVKKRVQKSKMKSSVKLKAKSIIASPVKEQYTHDEKESLLQHKLTFLYLAALYLFCGLIVGNLATRSLNFFQKQFLNSVFEGQVYAVWTSSASIFIAGVAGFCFGLLLLVVIQRLVCALIPSVDTYLKVVRKEHYDIISKGRSAKEIQKKKAIDNIRAFEKNPLFHAAVFAIILSIVLLYFSAFFSYAVLTEDGLTVHPYLNFEEQTHSWKDIKEVRIMPYLSDKPFFDGSHSNKNLDIGFIIITSDGLGLNIAEFLSFKEMDKLYQKFKEKNVFIYRYPLRQSISRAIINVSSKDKAYVHSILRINVNEN